MRAIVSIVFGAGVCLGLFAWHGTGLNFSNVAIGQALPGTAEAGNDVHGLSDQFESVAQIVLPAVVSIDATKPSTTSGTKSSSVEDSGSGVIVSAFDRPGFVVVTNNHVVAGATPEQISINLADGRLIRPKQVLFDVETDIAVLRIDSPSLPAAKWADSDRVKIGQWVLALGSPFGLSQSVTHGIISARERGQIRLGDQIRVKEFLQTDAAINPGSSGGPLVNLRGEIVGINTAIASESGSNSGVAFSIPSNLVKRVVKQLLDRGSVSYGYLGMKLDPGFQPASAVNLGLDRARGARVEAVMPESPASAAGLKSNDVVLQLDSVQIRNDNHLINLISMLPAGQRIRLQIWRDRKAYAVEAVVGDWGTVKARLKPTSSKQ